MDKTGYGRISVGQARQRRTAGFLMRFICALRKKRWAAVWYGFLILSGVLLCRAGAVYSLRWRGYCAVGGEVLIPLVLVLCRGVAVTIREIVCSWEESR